MYPQQPLQVYMDICFTQKMDIFIGETRTIPQIATASSFFGDRHDQAARGVHSWRGGKPTLPKPTEDHRWSVRHEPMYRLVFFWFMN